MRTHARRTALLVLLAAHVILALAATSALADPPTTTFAVDYFQSDLFVGSATAEIPIIVPAGAAGVAPGIVLRYNSATVDDLNPHDQGSSVGLGWTLDVGGFILRDTKGTLATSDDAFTLLFGGVKYDLVLIDATQNIYHTRDDIFVKVEYVAASDYWLLTAKDGTRYRFGGSAASQAIGLSADLVTPVTTKYLLDQVTTPSSVAIQYSYAKYTATASNGRTYDQAVYPDTISWAYSGGGVVGVAREVRFLRGARQDWTDTTATTGASYFERDRIETIEVRLGGALVRKYVLGFDYSIDRDSTYTWGGGATGDLTLRTATMYGTDGVSTLPAVSFTYSGAYLGSASSGIGGTVTYVYERILTQPLYAVCSSRSGTLCVDWGVCTDPDPWNLSILIGHIPTANNLGNSSLYSVCAVRASGGWSGCADWGGCSDPDPWGFSLFLGYPLSTNLSGTVPVYSMCLGLAGGGWSGCAEWAVSNQADGWGFSSLLGYVYRAKIDRARVVSKTTSDGRGTSSTITFSYSGVGLSDDGKEFRGHATVRATDALGNYTDTWFHQDDARKGRASQSETHASDGSLFIKVVNSWATSTPYPGVTVATLTRADVYNCEGGAPCVQTAQSFEYDGYTNITRIYQWGDVAVAGDERDERVDWAVDTSAWLHRPIRSVLYDASAAVVRERWLSYDSLPWGSLGTRGRVTSDESRLAGPRGAQGNPVVMLAYDAYGNLTSETDPRSCTTTTSYESSQTYPAASTSCLSHTTNLQYDARWGRLTQRTDPNGQATTYSYDVFGRLTRITGPLDTASLYGSASYEYVGLGDPASQRIVARRTTQHGTATHRWSEAYFDGLGRIYLTRAQAPAGQVIATDATFDVRGLVSARSTPHLTTEAAVWTQFSYDPLRRQTQILHADGTTRQVAYAPTLQTLTDERGSVKREFFDGYRRLSRVEEVNGTETYATTYQYDAANFLVGIVNHLGQVTTVTYDLMGRKIAMQDPYRGSWTYSYDLAGNLLTQRDARLQTVTFTYDAAGRVTSKQYSGGAHIVWTYDDPVVPYSKGRVTQINDLATTTTFRYDALGRVVQRVRLLDGTTYTMSQSYDAQGRVTSQTFPDAQSVSYTYDEAGRLNGVPGYVNSIVYDARGQQTQIQYANGVTSVRSYHPNRFWLTSQTTSGSAGQHQNLSYTHDAVGNVAGITDTVGTAGRTFIYDPLNRLISASGSFGPNQSSVTETYRYDGIGNILEKAGVLYTYSDPSRPNAVTVTSDGRTFAYDANGNRVTDGAQTFVWDADNRLQSFTPSGGGATTYAYDVTGRRVRKTTSAGVTRYPFKEYEVGPTGVVIKRFGGVLKKSTGEVLFYHTDRLGGLHVVTNSSGVRVQRVEYEPWGRSSRNEGSGDATIRFAGEELDGESGLYYMGGRYYDAPLGRFISPDPFVVRADDPQSLNRYAYVRNNPVNRVDPTGFEDADSDGDPGSDPGDSEGLGGFGLGFGGFAPTFSMELTITFDIGAQSTLGPSGFGPPGPQGGVGSTGDEPSVGRPSIFSLPTLMDIATRLGPLGIAGVIAGTATGIAAAPALGAPAIAITGLITLMAVAGSTGGDSTPGGEAVGGDPAANIAGQSTPAPAPTPDPSDPGRPDSGPRSQPTTDRVGDLAKATEGKIGQFARGLSRMSNLKTGTPLSQEEAQKAFNTLKARGADPDIDPSHLAGHSGRPSGQYPHFKVGDIYIWVEPGVSISP